MDPEIIYIIERLKMLLFFLERPSLGSTMVFFYLMHTDELGDRSISFAYHHGRIILRFIASEVCFFLQGKSCIQIHRYRLYLLLDLMDRRSSDRRSVGKIALNLSRKELQFFDNVLVSE